jgi:hypothetical protein
MTPRGDSRRFGDFVRVVLLSTQGAVPVTGKAPANRYYGRTGARGAPVKGQAGHAHPACALARRVVIGDVSSPRYLEPSWQQGSQALAGPLA